jgi:hypothetical protein
LPGDNDPAPVEAPEDFDFRYGFTLGYAMMAIMKIMIRMVDMS